VPSAVSDFIAQIKELAQDPQALLDPEKIKLVVTACKNTMVLLVFGIFVTICYMGIFDTAYRPNVQKMGVIDTSIEEMKKRVDEKNQQDAQFKEWVSHLKDLHTEIPILSPNQAPQVAAIALTKQILDIAKGVSRVDLGSEPLPEPHNIRHVVSFKPVDQKEINIVEKDPNAKNPVLLEQFLYELKIQGTYAGIADVLNQLVMLKDLVELRSVVIDPIGGTKASRASAAPEVPALVEPDAPEGTEPSASSAASDPVQLVLTFALYFAKGS
jgi:hypothetical protein